MKTPAVIAAIVLAAHGAAGQVRDTPVPSTRGRTDATVLANGWSALAAGRIDAAARAADELLRRRPWDHAAATLAIDALSTREPMEGLDAYEKWLGSRTAEDPGLLEPIARAVVVRVAREGEPDLRREALRMLQEARVPEPPQSGAADPLGRLFADARRAAAGDTAAIQRLEAAAVDPSSRTRAAVVDALEAAGPAGVPGLVRILSSPSGGPDRAHAAAALGRLQSEEGRPALQQMLQDQDPFVRASAAVALSRMADPAGQTYVERMLQSGIPDLQLMAAATWDGAPGPWVGVVRPLLQNQDGLIRLHAARTLAPVDPEAARQVLQDAAGDPNPAVRASAAAIVEQLPAAATSAADISALRRLLRDPDTLVRLRAAGALLTAVRRR